MIPTRVTVMTVTYGKRWEFLSQVILAIMKDPHVVKLIIVDNGSKNKEEIENGVKKYGDKVVILRQEKNLGSAGGFATAFAYAQKTECDFVFVLDDDNVPEEGAISKFLEIRKFFPDEKVVLVGNRLDVNVRQDFFYNPPIKNESSEKLMFKVLSFSIITRFLRLVIQKYESKKIIPFTPIIPMIGFAYGGSFIPISAVRVAPLPDASLVLYGDDSEYSKGISRIGYNIYLCSRPYIYDVDLSFVPGKEANGRAPSSFDVKTPPFKIYFSIRNMVRISINYSYKMNPLLFLKIVVWIVGLCSIGLIKGGRTNTYIKRVKLIFRAVHDGYVMNAKVPEEATLP